MPVRISWVKSVLFIRGKFKMNRITGEINRFWKQDNTGMVVHPQRRWLVFISKKCQHRYLKTVLTFRRY